MKYKFWNILLLKFYFEKGWALTNYAKYLVLFLGLFDIIQAREAIIIGFVYVVTCFITGWLWCKFKLMDTELEIQNSFNPFTKDVRSKLKVTA